MRCLIHPFLAADSSSSATAVQWSAIATAFGAVIALAVGVLTVILRKKADDRAEWWRRAQWAIDHAVSDKPVEVEAGLGVLLELIESKLAEAEELTMLREVVQIIVESLEVVPDADPA